MLNEGFAGLENRHFNTANQPVIYASTRPRNVATEIHDTASYKLLWN